MLDFRIDTFLSVCHYMNFTHAAKALNLTQPAVSQHIKFLENKYRAALFIRENKKLRLTPSGEILLAAFRSLKSDELALERQLSESLTAKRRLVFGVTMTIGEYILAPLLSNYIGLQPELDIHVRVANTHTLLNELQQGQLNFIVVEGYFNADHYAVKRLKLEEYIAVTSSRHVFARPIQSLSDLTAERLITKEKGSGTRAILSRSLALKNLSIDHFKHVLEVENIHAIVDLLVRDCGISFLYKAAVQQQLTDGSLKQIMLPDFKISHQFSFLWNKNSIFSEDYRAIYRDFKASFDSARLYRRTPTTRE